VLELSDLASRSRTSAIKHLAAKILQLPVKYAVPLATNLAIDGIGDTDPEGLQVITTTLAETLRRLPPNEQERAGFEQLAELVLYAHTRASLDDPRYRAAITTLKTNDQHRSQSDFTLSDMQGNQWNLKSLRGRVVLVNFWATWCPPCRAELADLNAIHERFHSRGLVILGISEEDNSTLNRFLSQNKLTYPVLLDPGDVAKKQFLVPGFPESYVYDRAGRLVAQSIYQTGMQGFLQMLAQAGL
jgi:peroxiredoxin